MAGARPRSPGGGRGVALTVLTLVIALVPLAAADADLYDLTRWGLRNSRSVNKIAASLSKLIEKMPRDQFYRLLDFHRMPQNGTASTAYIMSLLNGKSAQGITVLLPDTLGLGKSARVAMMPFLVLAGPVPQQGTNFSQLADPSNTRVSYAPALNAFFNATYGLRGTWRFAPTGKPFTLRRACRGPRLQLPRQRGVRLDSCSKMLGRVSFQVVEYDRPMEKGQYDRLLALRAKFKRQPATTESDGCTNSETRCLYLSDATALIPRSEFLSRFVGLRGIYGESSMLTEAPRIYDLPDNPNEAGGAGSVVQLSFDDPMCSGYSLTECLYVPPGVLVDPTSIGESLAKSSTETESYYTETGVSADVSAGYGAFEAEVGASYETTSLESSSYYTVKVYAYQKLYSMKLEVNAAAQYLTQTFKDDVAALNAATINATTFVNKYGCYYLSGLYVGGKYRMSTSYSIYSTEDTETAQLQVEAEYQAYAASAEGGASQTTSTYDTEATLFWRAVGGDATQTADYNAWASTVWSSTWVMMDTTNQPLINDYSGTTKITADNGPMVQAGATSLALDDVNTECIWSLGPANTSSLNISSQSCSYTYDANSGGRDGCTYQQDDVTTSPAYLAEPPEYRQNYVTGLCGNSNTDQKMDKWGTWLSDIKTGTKSFSAGTKGNTGFTCDPWGNCSTCDAAVNLEACAQAPPGTVIVGVCITVNANEEALTGITLWWARIQPYENDGGFYRTAFDDNNKVHAKDGNGSDRPCDNSANSAKVLLNDVADAKWKNMVVTGVTTRYKDSNEDYLAVFTGSLALTTSTI